MNDFKRLYPFIRPYRAGLVLSLLLFSLVGIFQATTTTLSLPLFDNILMAGKSAAPAVPSKEGLVQKYVSFILSFMPGHLITKICLAMLILTVFKGICVYYSNYSMSRIGQNVVTDLRNDLFRHVLGQSTAAADLAIIRQGLGKRHADARPHRRRQADQERHPSYRAWQTPPRTTARATTPSRPSTRPAPAAPR